MSWIYRDSFGCDPPQYLTVVFGIQEDQKTVYDPEFGSFAELSRCHLAQEAPKNSPSGYGNRHGTIPSFFSTLLLPKWLLQSKIESQAAKHERKKKSPRAQSPTLIWTSGCHQTVCYHFTTAFVRTSSQLFTYWEHFCGKLLDGTAFWKCRWHWVYHGNSSFSYPVRIPCKLVLTHVRGHGSCKWGLNIHVLESDLSYLLDWCRQSGHTRGKNFYSYFRTTCCQLISH